MKQTFKFVLGALLAVLIALTAGYIWGSSGKRELSRALETAGLREELLAARGSLLNARVDLYIVNFGDASRDFETARTMLQRASDRLKALGRDPDVQKLGVALMAVDEGQRMAAKLDQTANARAAAAVKPVDDLLAAGR